MILDQDIKRILCYGDSNTWGQSDDKNYAGRYSLDARWPGRVQESLGKDYEIFEEGLGGRNTNFEHYNKNKTFRNGLDYFKPYLQSHDEFALIIIMLGTNDLKIQYNKSIQDVAASISEYINLIQEQASDSKILVISPPFINDSAPLFSGYYGDTYNAQSAEKSRQLGLVLEDLLKQQQVSYLNAANLAQPGKDGIHLTVEGHKKIADAVAQKIQEILK